MNATTGTKQQMLKIPPGKSVFIFQIRLNCELASTAMTSAVLVTATPALF